MNDPSCNEEEKQNMGSYLEEKYFSKSLFRKQLGIVIDSLDESGALLHIDLDDKFHTQSARFVHGGVISSLIDSSIATAARWFITTDQRIVTTDLNVHYLRPAKVENGPLYSRATMIHVGKTSLMGSCRIISGDKDVSFGTASFRILD